jgi:hypothetical protein
LDRAVLIKVREDQRVPLFLHLLYALYDLAHSALFIA